MFILTRLEIINKEIINISNKMKIVHVKPLQKYKYNTNIILI